MKQVVLDYKSGSFGVREVPAPKLKPGTLLVRTRCSLISAGTESGKVRLAGQSLIGKAKDRPDQVKKVIRALRERGGRETLALVRERLSTPQSLGYSCSGIVLNVADDVTAFQVGDRVACAAPHAEIVCVPRNLCVKIPDARSLGRKNNKQIGFEEAAFATIGAIAIQSIREADVHLGEKVAVIGLRLLGQLIVQLLKAAGCEVIGSDLDEGRLTLASELGVDGTVVPDSLEQFSQQFSLGKGVDAVIITADTKSNQPIELAGKISRQKGRVVVVGRIGMNVPREIFYMKELELKVSRSYGPGRYDRKYEEEGQDYPFAYVRWTENRNMEAFLSLLASGRINVEKLITHRFRIQEAEQAYNLILERTEPFLAVLLDYDNEFDSREVVSETRLDLANGPKISRLNSNQIHLGLIGCGNFARGVLVPKIKRLESVRIRAVCTQTGLSAQALGKRLQCQYCTTDFRDILDDPEVQAVVITTRHDTHAQIAIQALQAGKHVFVEKPLALTADELEQVKKAWLKTGAGRGRLLMVGFNRRFSPHARKLYEHFKDRVEPFVMHYRINAGPLPEDHWLLDPRLGGGRIIGEMCHFIDFFQFISDAEPEVICAQQPRTNAKDVASDNCQVALQFTDGSIGVISYITCGDPALPKELVEVFAGGRSAVIHDFRKTELYKNGRKKTFKTRAQDKGHKDEIEIFFHTLLEGGGPPVSFDSYYATTRTSFQILDLLKNQRDNSAAPNLDRKAEQERSNASF